MDNLIVGDAECSIFDIIEIIHNSPTASIVFTEWRTLARELGTSIADMNKYSQDLILDKKRGLDVVESILVEWRSRTGSKATLGLLLHYLKEKCKWVDLANSIRETIDKKHRTEK